MPYVSGGLDKSLGNNNSLNLNYTAYLRNNEYQSMT